MAKSGPWHQLAPTTAPLARAVDAPDPRSFGLPQPSGNHPGAQGLGAGAVAVLGRQVLTRQGRAKVAVAPCVASDKRAQPTASQPTAGSFAEQRSTHSNSVKTA